MTARSDCGIPSPHCLASFVIGNAGNFTGNVNRVAFSPDGTRLAVANWTLRVIDLRSKAVRSANFSACDREVAWSPDGQFLVTGTYPTGEVLLYAANTLQRIKSLPMPDRAPGKRRQIRGLEWSPDGKWIATCDSFDGSVRIWDARTHALKHTLKTGDNNLDQSPKYGLAWSSDSRRIAVKPEVTIPLIFDAVEGKVLLKPTAWNAGADQSTVCWNAARNEIVTAACGHVCIFDPTTMNELRRSPDTGRALDCGVWTMSPDGRTLATRGWESSEIVFWSIPEGTVSNRWTGVPKGLLSWSPDGAWLACYGDSPLLLINAATGRQRRELSGHPGKIRSVAWSPDGRRLAACGEQKPITVWDVAEGKVTLTLDGHEGGFPDFGYGATFDPCNIAWSPDSNRLASAGTDRQVRIWDAATGKQVASTADPFKASGPPGMLAWLPDGQHLQVRRADRAFLRLDASSALAASELLPGDIGGIDLQIAKNGKMGVATAAGSAYIWSADTGQTRSLGKVFWDCRWLPDDRRLVTFTSRFTPYRIYDSLRDEWLGVLYPRLSGEQYVCIGRGGHYRGSRKIDEHLVYVAMTEQGEQLTLTPDEFSRRFGWKNDPSKVRFAALDPEPEPAGQPLAADLKFQPVTGTTGGLPARAASDTGGQAASATPQQPGIPSQSLAVKPGEPNRPAGDGEPSGADFWSAELVGRTGRTSGQRQRHGLEPGGTNHRYGG